MLSLPAPFSTPRSSFLPWRKNVCQHLFIFHININVDALFGKQTTHAPLGGVPGCEPPSEGRWLKSLLDQDGGGVGVPVAWVGVQVLVARDHGFLALHLIGLFTDPEKHLREPWQFLSFVWSCWQKHFIKCSFLPGPTCPAAWHRPHWGRPVWTESPRSQWSDRSYWSIRTGVAGGLKPSAVTCQSTGVLPSLRHSGSSFANTGITFVSSPLVTGIGSFPSEHIPEFNRLLTLSHNLLRVFLANHRDDLLRHGSLISTRPLGK